MEKVVFVTGKHYYHLVTEREKRGLRGRVAIVRVELLAPFPTHHINEQLAKYKKAKGEQ